MRVAISPLSFRCTSPTDDGSLKFHTKRRGGRERRVGTTAAYFASSSSRAGKIGLVGKRGTITLKEVEEGSSVLTAVPLFFCRFRVSQVAPQRRLECFSNTATILFPHFSSRKKKRSTALLPPPLLLAPGSRTNYPPSPRLNFRGPAAPLAPPPPKGEERDNLLFGMPLKLRPGHGAIRLPYSSVLCIPLSALVHSSTPR